MTQYKCTNKYCYITEEPLSSNESEEHIIPNALGGHLKSNKLILSKVNTGLFDRLDAELVKRLEIAFLFEFKRERGKQPAIKGITQEGFEYLFSTKKVTMTSRAPIEFVNEETGKIYLKFPLHQKNEIINAILKKNPNLEKADIVKSVIEEITDGTQILYFEHGLNLIDNSVDSFRAISKIATNYAVLNNLNRSLFSNLISFIKGELGLEYINIGYFYPKQLFNYEFDLNEVSHILYLKGCKKENLLYCYIELFNLHCFLVILNYSYWGYDFTKSYIWDVRKGQELKKHISMSLTKDYVPPPFYPQYPEAEKDYSQRLSRLSSILNLKIRKK